MKWQAWLESSVSDPIRNVILIFFVCVLKALGFVASPLPISTSFFERAFDLCSPKDFLENLDCYSVDSSIKIIVEIF